MILHSQFYEVVQEIATNVGYSRIVISFCLQCGYNCLKNYISCVACGSTFTYDGHSNHGVLSVAMLQQVGQGQRQDLKTTAGLAPRSKVLQQGQPYGLQPMCVPSDVLGSQKQIRMLIDMCWLTVTRQASPLEETVWRMLFGKP